jgi:hypothetical protein
MVVTPGTSRESFPLLRIQSSDGLVKEKYRNFVAQGTVDLVNSPVQGNEGNIEEPGRDEGESPKQSLLDCYYQQTVTESDEMQQQNGNSISQTNLEIWTRITPQEEYVKLVIYRGRVIGALLIGDTDLEEVCENLILNELDVRRYGMELLDPDIDIEDYFD